MRIAGQAKLQLDKCVEICYSISYQKSFNSEVKLMEHYNKHEHGQGMVEYGLIIGLIAVIVIAIFVALGPQIKTIFQGKSTTSVEQTTNGTSTTTGTTTQTATGTATAQ